MVAGTNGSLDKAGATKMTQTNTLTAGIDTSKAKLDVAVEGSGECWQAANTPQGWGRLAAALVKLGVGRAGIEATGGYERGVVAHCERPVSRFWFFSPRRCAPTRACTCAGPRTTGWMRCSLRRARRE